ncbi:MULTISPECIES: cupin domain-containing protein [Nostoc]|uniref:Cupin domain-containing protein n=2 Tax=Nostoc TaxID=1177 RepID=A0ABR8I9K8_9NOSO|nr:MULTISPECIES: cupin domain-containing protein [Nostoc]MBD2562161.1 cupin domain-containing protein [Nostoc linckia FACHB-391]MBD2647562.1 cupin domain-containing protein [Nostoc foliaceum FACHB-393]
MVTKKKLSMLVAGAVISGFCLGLQAAYAHGGQEHSGHEEEPENVLVVPPEAPGREAFYASGDLYTFLATGKETKQLFSLFNFDVPSGGGPDLHVHGREAESFFILQGELTVQMGDRNNSMVATPGTFIYLPKGRPHSFINNTSTLVRTLSLTTPAGLENLFINLGIPVTDRNVPPPPITEEDLRRFAEEGPNYGLQPIPPGTTLPPTDGLLDFVVVPPGAPNRESFLIGGNRYTSLATGNETGGLFSLFDVSVQPQAEGGLLQSNSKDAESFYVLAGELTFELENQSFVAKPGTFVYLPEDTPYSFQNLGTTQARTLFLRTPTPVPEPSSWLGVLGFGTVLVLKQKQKQQKLASFSNPE